MKVCIIGAGASGMIAGIVASNKGDDVTIYEKNAKPGRKIMITGKGRCNLTNDTDVETVLNNTPGNPYFLYSALYSFPPEDTIRFFNKLGLSTKVERGQRVFPVSDKSSDVVDVLYNKLKKNKVKMEFSMPVKQLFAENGKIKAIGLSNNEVKYFDKVIVATGGITYKTTGSTGDGQVMVKEIGHSVIPMCPSLVPLKVLENWSTDLQGLSLKNVKVTLKDDRNKKIYDDFGEMMFTHMNTVTGPVILTASRYVTRELNINKQSCFHLYIDLKPSLDKKTLDERLIKDFAKYINKDFRNSLDDLLPKKMIPIIIMLSKINPAKKVNEITKEERKNLVDLLKNLHLTITGTLSDAYGVITSGGIFVDEINPSTMESKLIKGLYFAGEVIDIDAFTGGFNLQLAFSTGYLAGKS